MATAENLISWASDVTAAKVFSDGRSLLLVLLPLPLQLLFSVVLTIVVCSDAASADDSIFSSISRRSRSGSGGPNLLFTGGCSSSSLSPPPVISLLAAPTRNLPAAVASRRGVFSYISRPVDMAVAGPPAALPLPLAAAEAGALFHER